MHNSESINVMVATWNAIAVGGLNVLDWVVPGKRPEELPKSKRKRLAIILGKGAAAKKGAKKP